MGGKSSKAKTPAPAAAPAAAEKPAATPAAAEKAPAKEETKPAPVAADAPKPAVEETKPAAAEETKPAAEEPKPAAEEPKPAEEAKPAAEEPKPAEEAKPAAEEPKPAAEEPKPAAEEPKPAEEEAKPAAEEPKPAEEEAKPAAGKYDAFLEALEKVKAENPDNRCAKYLTKEIFLSFPEAEQEYLYRCARTGVDNPDSSLGCYAMRPTDYKTFGKFFDQVIRDYHKAGADSKHVTDWDISAVGENGVLDVTKLGLSELSMRVRVGRNLTKFNLPGAMDRAERIAFEKTMLEAFQKLIEKPEYGGKIYSLTPDFGEGEANPNLISAEQYQKLIDDHIMFKDMDADPYLKSAGISSDWPYGRGCYVSEDQQFIIWFGEEDQLRIMCMKKGTLLNEVFERLNQALSVVESIPGIQFAKDDDYGYITSCPSNLGTGMRASVHIKVPNLTKDGSDAKAKEVCKPLGLSVRGTGGEHTPIGADGTIDLSPSARLFIKERDIIQALYTGIERLMEKEKEAAA